MDDRWTGTKPHARYFAAVDGLRFFAFLLVFIRHIGPPPIPGGDFLWNFGWAGVDLFFLLTGFLFYVILHEEVRHHGRIHFGAFYLRRILRIMPLYFLFLAISVGWALHIGSAGVLTKFAAYATLTMNLFASFRGGDWILPYAGHLWTICYEEQAYLLLPVVIASILGAKNRKTMSVAVLVAAALAGMLLRFLALRNQIGTENWGPYYVPFLRPETLIAGVLCGMAWTSGAYRRIPSWVYGLAFVLLIAGLFSWTRINGYAAFAPEKSIAVYPVLAVAFSALLLYTVSEGSLFGWLMSRRPLMHPNASQTRGIRPREWLGFPWLGKISYGLYVWHLLCLNLTTAWLLRPFGVARWYGLKFVTVLIVTILVSALSYYLYEQWFLRLKRRYTYVENRPV